MPIHANFIDRPVVPASEKLEDSQTSDINRAILNIEDVTPHEAYSPLDKYYFNIGMCNPGLKPLGTTNL